MSNTLKNLHCSTETAMAVISHQLGIPTDESQEHCAILFIFSKQQKEKSEFQKIKKHITL